MHAVGVDIGGTKIAVGVVDDDGRILAQTRRATDPEQPAGIDAAIADAVAELARDYEFTAVGVAAAGFVSSDGERVIFAPNIAWRDYPLARTIKAAMGRPDLTVTVENDANAAGWAEFAYGAGHGLSTMVMLTIGTGLGAAIVIDGRMLRGAHGFAAELGHLRAVPDGRPCGCGQRGCWEQYAAGSALVRGAKKRAKSEPAQAARILELANGDPATIDGPMVTKAAQEGDALAIELLAEVGSWIGQGCASLAAVLDPQIFVVGGGVIAAGDLLLDPARDAFGTHLSARGHRTTAPIVAAAMGNDAGIVGAAALARLRSEQEA